MFGAIGLLFLGWGLWIHGWLAILIGSVALGVEYLLWD